MTLWKTAKETQIYELFYKYFLNSCYKELKNGQ
jgi:hypothetical protein